MPNWCNNTLEITHSDPAMLERARVAFKEGRLLDEFVPVPKSLHIVAGRVGDDTDPLQIDLKAQEKANLEAHGYSTWYDYCVNEWGTKWDVGGDDLGPAQDIPGGLIMCFAGLWEDGDDDYYDLSNMNSEQVREELPEHLDEAYGISECMAEWEAENEEQDEMPHEFSTTGTFTIEGGLKDAE